MFGARTFADHTFCSLNCIVIAKRAGLREPVREPTDPSSPKLLVPVLAIIHALTPLLLLATGLLARADSAMTPIALALFWSWPFWLWPMIRYRHCHSTLSALALATSLLVQTVATLPMLTLTGSRLFAHIKL
jgi:hypothetical protein